MKKNQTDRLSKQHVKSKGSKGIFGASAQQHETSVKDVSKLIFESLKVDNRLGVTLFVDKSAIKPDGGVIEVKDKESRWRIILVSEAKHQGKDIENISKGILVGKKKNQDIMVAGNAVERSHKNINEIRNIMVDEEHFPYVLFLQGQTFLQNLFRYHVLMVVL